MPNKGGKKRQRGKKKMYNDNRERELITRDDDTEEYAQVVTSLGDGRFSVFCFDGVTRIAKVPGRFRKKVWINKADIILVSKRIQCDSQDNKTDILHKYHSDEVRRLMNDGEIPKTIDLTNPEKSVDNGNQHGTTGITQIGMDETINSVTDQPVFNFDDI